MITNPLTGRYKANSKALFSILENCKLCPRECGVNRLKGLTGFCKSGLSPLVYSWFSHPGEEPPISGSRGSGTIFFTHCTMHCVYCQNYEFSQLSSEKEMPIEELAGIMLELQRHGCHNINLVTPTHFAPQIAAALIIASASGLHIPIVYNTSGYESVSTLRLLDGVVDIYLADMRYSDEESAKRFSNTPDYVKMNRKAVKEMFRQVGNLVTDDEGVAKRGLIIRHLVLPNNISSPEKVFKFISKEISKDACVSLMSQYHPVYKAGEFPEINRGLTAEEYETAFKSLLKYGLSNGWAQEITGRTDPKLLGTNIKKTW